MATLAQGTRILRQTSRVDRRVELEIEAASQLACGACRRSANGSVFVVEGSENQRQVLGVTDHAERSTGLSPDPRQLVAEPWNSRRASRTDIAQGGHLETHLGRPPVLVAQPGDNGVRHLVDPDIEQAARSPRTGPVGLPDAIEGSLSCTATKVGEHADVVVRVGAAEKLGAPHGSITGSGVLLELSQHQPWGTAQIGRRRKLADRHLSILAA
jgi:hypothetical protein